ncbi:hypothetical protein ALC62_06231, partial [Cyphomyrmex costatus]
VASVGNIARGQIYPCLPRSLSSRSFPGQPGQLLRRAEEHRRDERRHEIPEVSDSRNYSAGPDGCEKRPSTCATTSLFANTITRPHIPFRLHVLVEPRDSVYYYYYRHRRLSLSLSSSFSPHSFAC